MSKFRIVSMALTTLMIGSGSALAYVALSDTHSLTKNVSDRKKSLESHTESSSFTNTNTNQGSIKPLYLANNGFKTISSQNSETEWIDLDYQYTPEDKGYKYRSDILVKGHQDVFNMVDKLKELDSDGGKGTTDSARAKEYAIVNKNLAISTDSWRRPNLQEVPYKGIADFDSPDYLLVNSLALVGNQNNTNKHFLATFANFLKDVQVSGRRLSTYTETHEIKYVAPIDDECAIFNAQELSPNPFQALMGEIYGNINCGNGFHDFDLGAFLTNLFETGEQDVYISDILTGEKEGTKILTFEEAHRLTTKSVGRGSFETLNVDIVEWLQSLTLDKLNEIPKLISLAKRKISYGSSKNIYEALADSVKSSDFLDESSVKSMALLFKTITSGVNKASRIAKEKGIVGSDFLSSKDILGDLLTAGERGVQKLIKELLFNDETYNKMFIDNGYDLFLKELERQDKDSYDFSSLSKEVEDFEERVNKFHSGLKYNQDEITKISNNHKQELEDAKGRLEIQEKETSRVQSIFNTAKRRYSVAISNEESAKRVLENEKNSPTPNSFILNLQARRVEESIAETAEYKLLYETALHNWKREKYAYDRIIEDFPPLKKFLQHTEAIKQLNKDNIHLISQYKKRKGELDSILKDREFIKRQKQHILNMKNTNNIEAYVENIGMFDLIAIATGLIKNTAVHIFKDLGLATIGSDGIAKIEVDHLTSGNLDNLKPLFFDKTSIAKLNKMINYANKIADNFPTDDLELTSKLFYNILPKEALDLMNLEFSVAGKYFRFSEGINVTPQTTFGILTSGTGLLGASTGAITGGVVGGLVGGSKGVKVGATVGGVVGGLSGVAIGGGLSHNYFNDGYLTINKPSKVLVDLFKKIKKSKENKESPNKVSFNLFTDGHALMKTIFLEDLNKIFSNVAKSFLHSESNIFNEIESIQNQFSGSEKFTPWQMIGETFKTFMLSPKALLTSMSGDSYNAKDKVIKKRFRSSLNTQNLQEFQRLGQAFFKEDVIEEIKRDTSYDWNLIKKISNSDNSLYINKLLDLHKKVHNWLSKSALLGLNTRELDLGVDDQGISIGYDPTDISKEGIEAIIEDFKQYYGFKKPIKAIAFNGSKNYDNAVFDLRFEYVRQTKAMNEFNKLTREQQNDVMIHGKAESLPSDHLYGNNSSAKYPLFIPIRERRFKVVTHKNNIPAIYAAGKAEADRINSQLPINDPRRISDPSNYGVFIS